MLVFVIQYLRRYLKTLLTFYFKKYNFWSTVALRIENKNYVVDLTRWYLLYPNGYKKKLTYSCIQIGQNEKCFLKSASS